MILLVSVLIPTIPTPPCTLPGYLIGSFIVSYFFEVNVVFVILACALVGSVATIIRGRRAKAKGGER